MFLVFPGNIIEKSYYMFLKFWKHKYWLRIFGSSTMFSQCLQPNIRNCLLCDPQTKTTTHDFHNFCSLSHQYLTCTMAEHYCSRHLPIKDFSKNRIPDCWNTCLRVTVSNTKPNMLMPSLVLWVHPPHLMPSALSFPLKKKRSTLPIRSLSIQRSSLACLPLQQHGSTRPCN